MGGDRRNRPRQRPKTYTRWLRGALLANGIDPNGLAIDDAQAAVAHLVYFGKAIPPHKWVDHLIEKHYEDLEAGLPHHNFFK